MTTEEHDLIEEVLEGIMDGSLINFDVSDVQARMELEADIEHRCGPVVGGCWTCGIEVRQHEPLKSGAKCPFCGKFMKRG